MRFFSSELAHEYSKTLTFGYCNYGVLEPGDAISDMYERGYLPYSGSPDSKGMFYMARSGRIHLPKFELDSECRRVGKKFDGKMTREMTPLSDFKITEDFIHFWLTYFERAHGPAIVSRDRLMHWLNFGIVTHVGTYKNEADKIVAHTLEVWDGTMAHDWYQSYAAELDRQSFGVWILLDVARTAKERGATYYYPGTVYSENSYKTNLPALEFWNGGMWIADSNNKRLRERTKTDSKRHIALLDEWKENHPLF
ncbi:MAG: GNAT family N-acetyltransferase [Minisyncoccia bacterium]